MINNGDNWVNLSADFGAPWKTFTISLRSELGRKFVGMVSEWAKTSDDRQKWLPLVAASIVVQARPSLNDGLVICGIRMTHFGRVSIDAVHQSFPMVPNGGLPETERLEACPACGKPLGEQEWVRLVEDDYGAERSEVVCSERCSKAVGYRRGREFI